MTYDIKYMKMPNYYNRKDEIIDNFEITEKIDGANFRWVYKDDKVYFGSRNHMNILIGEYVGDSYRIIDDKGATLGDKGSGGTFRKFAEFVMSRKKTHMIRTTRYKDFVFYGEAVGSHKINYKIDPERMVVGFAVYDTVTEKYLPNWYEYFTFFGVPTVEVIFADDVLTGTPDHIWNNVINNEKVVSQIKSWYDNESRIEGIVIADYKNQTFFKLKTKEFLETKMEKQKINGLHDLIQKYATNERLEHIILKMQNDELKYNPKNPMVSLIGYFMKDVMEDITIDDFRKILKPMLNPAVAKFVRDSDAFKIVMGLKK